jgi:molecular chaperone GrpE
MLDEKQHGSPKSHDEKAKTESDEKELPAEEACEAEEVEIVEASEIDKLKDELKAANARADENYNQMLLLRADFENFRKRSEKEKREYLDIGREKILLKQIAMDDVLAQALKSAKMGGKTEDIIIGLDMINKEFMKMLKEEGVEEIVLEKNDPNLCEALAYSDSDEDDGTILEVYQKGYKMNGRLMRPVKARVAKKKASDKKDDQPQDENSKDEKEL